MTFCTLSFISECHCHCAVSRKKELPKFLNLQGETGQIQPNPTKSKHVPGCLPGQVNGQSKAHPCLVFSTNVSDHSLLYSENVSGTVSVSHILGECLWRCLYTLKMSLALRPIFGQCWPALAVVCSLFSDNGGQVHLLSLLFLKNCLLN